VNLPDLLRAFLAGAALASAACATEARTPAAAQPASRPPIAVAVAPVITQTITESIDIVGSLSPKFTAEVKAEVTGIVTAVFVTEWTPVRVGQPLVRLDSSETEATIEALRAGAAQAAVAETRAKREHARGLELLRYGLITPQAADDARSALDAADASIAAARAQIRAAESRLAKFSIKAPMAGVVSLRRVNVGDRVENIGGGEPMFRIVDNRLLELTATVPASRAAAVRVGQSIDFATDGLPSRQFMGRVMFINPAVDDASRAVRVVAEVPNGDGALKGGFFVRGRIQTSVRDGVRLVARESLLNWNVAGGTADVFVVQGDCAHLRPVRVGAVTPAGVEIVDGLESGDAVVTRGAFALRPGDRVSVEQPSHTER
jgi:membrane fusion protein, multidrug efflux system